MTQTFETDASSNPLVESVLDLWTDFCDASFIAQNDAWLFVDLTMPQVKALYLVVRCGTSTCSGLARGLGVGLPSASRLVDRLLERELVEREEDARDRRVTQIVPTPAGREVIESLVSYKREHLANALRWLDRDQLLELEQGLTHLVRACRTESEAEAQSRG